MTIELLSSGGLSTYITYAVVYMRDFIYIDWHCLALLIDTMYLKSECYTFAYCKIKLPYSWMSILKFIQIRFRFNNNIHCLYFLRLQYVFILLYTTVEHTVHYNDVMMGAMVSQITGLTFVHSTAYLGADQRKHRSCSSLAFVRGIHRWPVNFPHKGTGHFLSHVFR